MKGKKTVSFMIIMVMLISSVIGVNAADAKKFSETRPDGNSIYPSSKTDAFYYLNWNYWYDNGSVTIYRMDLAGKNEELQKIQRCKHDYYYRDDFFYYMSNYDYTYANGYKIPVYKLDLLNNKIEKLFEYQGEYLPSAMGVDASERIYIAVDSTVKIFDKTGNELAEKDIDDTINEFCGFDSSNGNFYVMSHTDWQSYGYTYDMKCLKVGNYSDNTINYNTKSVVLIHQDKRYSHEGCIEMLNNQYLGVFVPMIGEKIHILDSSKIKYDNVIDTVSMLNPVNNETSVTSVALSNSKEVKKMTLQTKAPDYVYSHDQSGVGVMATYYKPRNSFFVATDKNKISEYDIDGNSVGFVNTTYEIYKLMSINGKVAAIEKDGNNYYVESFDTSLPSTLSLTGNNHLLVGNHAKYEVNFNSELKRNYTISSSDSSILSISDDGYAEAWKAGSVKITAESQTGLKSTLDVTVSARSTDSYTSVLSLNGKLSNNLDMNNYSMWSKEVNSYLTETATGLMRLENIDGTLQVEYYDTDGKVTSSLMIGKELSDFAGFYAGKDNYYVAFKQANDNESDEQEILRIVKYDKSWKRLSATSIKGANTYLPVVAGSLRMSEDNGILYVHTCHQMYKSDDNLNHQANMTFSINEEDMSVKDSYTDIMNLSEGYVSHSFNQFIKTEDGKIYRVDHGDATPRGIAYTVTSEDEKLSRPTVYNTVVGFDGVWGDNYTGVSVGGFELSATNALIAYNQDDDISTRNVKLVSFRKDGSEETNDDNIIRLTNYSDKDQITCMTPQLVKVDDYHFILMWQEKNTSTQQLTAKFVQIDHLGHKVSDIVEKKVPLSDVQPVITGDGLITWYVSYKDKLKLYKLNPFDLNAMSDDEDFLTEEKKELADIDQSQTASETNNQEQTSQNTNKVNTPKQTNTQPSQNSQKNRNNKNRNNINTKIDLNEPQVKPNNQLIKNQISAVASKSNNEDNKEEVVRIPQKQKSQNKVNKPVMSNSHAITKKISTIKNDKDIKHSSFVPLKLRLKKANKKSITIKWSKVPKAQGYLIYGNKCTKKYKFLKDSNKTSATFKKLRKGTYYKYVIVAYNKKYQILAIAKTIHVSTAGGKSGSYKTVKLKSGKKVQLKKGKSVQISAHAIKSSKNKKVKKHCSLRYESTNRKKVTVSAKGKLKAKKKGKCSIYVYDQCGHYKKIDVSVK